MANFSDCVKKHTNEENIGNGLQVLSKELRIVSHGATYFKWLWQTRHRNLEALKQKLPSKNTTQLNRCLYDTKQKKKSPWKWLEQATKLKVLLLDLTRWCYTTNSKHSSIYKAVKTLLNTIYEIGRDCCRHV